MTDKIADALGVEPIEENKIEIINTDILERGDEDDDYQFARENFYNVIEKGVGVLDDMIDAAAQSKEPRAYEVISGMIKVLTDANKDLVEVGEKRLKIKDATKAEETGNKVTNNVFVGSTAELQKMLQDMKNDDTG